MGMVTYVLLFAMCKGVVYDFFKFAVINFFMLGASFFVRAVQTCNWASSVFRAGGDGRFRLHHLRAERSHVQFCTQKMTGLQCDVSAAVHNLATSAKKKMQNRERQARGHFSVRVRADCQSHAKQRCGGSLFDPSQPQIPQCHIFPIYPSLYVSRQSTDDFHPEVLGSSLSFTIVLIILEVLAYKVGFYISKTDTINTLDLLSFAGYKYVSTCMICIVTLAFSAKLLTWPLFLYFSACSAIVVWAALRHIQPSGNTAQMGQTMLHQYIVYICAGCQVPLIWILSPAAS